MECRVVEAQVELVLEENGNVSDLLVNTQILQDLVGKQQNRRDGLALRLDGLPLSVFEMLLFC